MFKKETDADLILPNLWLGNYKVALNSRFLQKYHIRYIVNITTDIPCIDPKINYFKLRVERHDSCNIYMNPIIDQIVDFIHKGLRSGYGVLVHCKKGHHRSASIILAYLIKYHDLSFIEGLNYIRRVRPGTLKRPACMVLNVYSYYLEKLKNTS